MKLRFLVLAALGPMLVSAQSFFDYFNPFFWFFNGVLNAIVSENAICFLMEGTLEGAIGEEGVIQCTSCSNVVNVFFFVPTGVTTEAVCQTNAILDLNNLPGESNMVASRYYPCWDTALAKVFVRQAPRNLLTFCLVYPVRTAS